MSDVTIIVKKIQPIDQEREKPKTQPIKGFIAQPWTPPLLLNRAGQFTATICDISSLVYGGITDNPTELNALLTNPPRITSAAAIGQPDSEDTARLQFFNGTGGAMGFWYDTRDVFPQKGNQVYSHFFGDPWVAAGAA